MLHRDLRRSYGAVVEPFGILGASLAVFTAMRLPAVDCAGHAGRYLSAAAVPGLLALLSLLSLPRIHPPCVGLGAAAPQYAEFGYGCQWMYYF